MITEISQPGSYEAPPTMQSSHAYQPAYYNYNSIPSMSSQMHSLTGNWNCPPPPYPPISASTVGPSLQPDNQNLGLFSQNYQMTASHHQPVNSQQYMPVTSSQYFPASASPQSTSSEPFTQGQRRLDYDPGSSPMLVA